MQRTEQFPLVRQVGRVPSTPVPLDRAQELRLSRLRESLLMIDLHAHPMVLPESPDDFVSYLRGRDFRWGYESYVHGGWTAVGVATSLGSLGHDPDPSNTRFTDIVDEVGLLLSDVSMHAGVIHATSASDILAAKQENQLAVLATVEHLAIGDDLQRVNVLHGLGVRVAGLTYSRGNLIGDGQQEASDRGLSEFGRAVIGRMNDLGMIVDISHAGSQTALDTIDYSDAPVVFSHNAAYGLMPSKRARSDDELRACAGKGGLVCVIAVPNNLSLDPDQDIKCVLDQIDYMVSLVGVDHVGIGSDMVVGDHVALITTVLGRSAHDMPAPYVSGFESPADGPNLVRGMITRGYSDNDIQKILGSNTLLLLKEVMG